MLRIVDDYNGFHMIPWGNKSPAGLKPSRTRLCVDLDPVIQSLVDFQTLRNSVEPDLLAVEHWLRGSIPHAKVGYFIFSEIM